MKKLLAMSLAVLLVFSLTACGNNSDVPEEKVDATEDVLSVESDENAQEETQVNAESENEVEDSSAQESKPAEESKVTNSNTEWRQFLKDYEKWVDNYIAFMKRYNANPSDLSLLSEYSKMLTDMAEWTEKADEIELELSDTSESLEFSAELLRIAAKLTEATAEIY